MSEAPALYVLPDGNAMTEIKTLRAASARETVLRECVDRCIAMKDNVALALVGRMKIDLLNTRAALKGTL